MTNGRSMNPILSICEESPYSYFWVNFPCNQQNEQVGGTAHRLGKSWQKHEATVKAKAGNIWPKALRFLKVGITVSFSLSG